MSESRRLGRRAFLAQSALGAASLAATRSLAPSSASGASPSNAQPAFLQPSNALVTGVNPDEFVLFAFDDHWLPLRYHLDLKLQQPSLCEKNPVLRLGAKGEPDCFFAALYGTVFHQDGKFRMWYGAVDGWEDFQPHRRNLRLAYAESNDGIDWFKPNLGLREYRGSTKNNLAGLDRECYNAMLLYEPDDPDPRRRYKMAYTGYRHRSLKEVRPLLCVAYSPDGLVWTDHPDNPVAPSTWSELGGLYRFDGVYYANGQTSWPPGAPKRTMLSFASADFEHWQPEGAISFARHDRSPAPGFQAGPQVHLGAAVWHRRNVLVGLYGQWEGPTAQQKGVRMNLGLILSNDGLLFREPVPDFALIAWGQERSNWQTLRLLQGNAFVNYGDQTYLWYGAASGDEQAIESHAMVGLASMPRDRFGYLKPFGPQASLVSNLLPAMPGGAELAVNVDGLGPEASLQIELLDQHFRRIPAGHGQNSATLDRSGLRQVVAWQGGNTATPLAQPWRVRVCFTGQRADTIRLYALYALERKSNG